MWVTLKRPKAEYYWADSDIVWCPAESYVPTSGARLVVTLHDAAHLEPGVRHAKASVVAQRLKWWWMLRQLQSDGTTFVTVSRFSADRLLHYYPWIKGRLWVVPNAVPRRFLLPPSAEGDAAVGRLGLAGTRVVLVPGGLSHQKNGALIVAAWEIISRCRSGLSLVIAGRSEDDLSAQCLSLCPGVRLLGYVSDEILRSLYAQADVVWFPSLYEGFGMPVLEGMAAGKPVVSCSASAIPEVAGDAAILLPTDAPAQHAEAILALLEDSGVRREYAERGLQRAKQFSWDASAERLIEVFHNALGAAGSQTCSRRDFAEEG